MSKTFGFRRLGRAVVWLIIGYLIILTAVGLLQQRFIFHPEKLPETYSFSFSEPFEERWLETADGARLNLLYFPASAAKGTILYFHGNAGSLDRWGAIAATLRHYGYNVLVMDYRGYGKSTGERSQQTLEQDARHCYRDLIRKVPEDQIIVYGRSLGTHFASLIASEYHPRMLILETPFTSITEVASGYLPLVPVKMLLRFPLDNTRQISRVSCPVIIFHGTADSVVPYALGKKLYGLANPPKKLVTIPGGDHNNLSDFPAYRQGLEAALK
ncbi:alpha/beta fold hydrolase [Niabella terrae]